MSQQQKIINWFVENDYKKVRVKDVEYECKEGLTTPGGFYKNGWRTTIKKGKNSDTKYLQIFIYTSASHNISVEEKFMFKIIESKEYDYSYKLVSWKGWDNVDLMRLDWQSQYMGMLTALYKSTTDDEQVEQEKEEQRLSKEEYEREMCCEMCLVKTKKIYGCKENNFCEKCYYVQLPVKPTRRTKYGLR
tara:strand:+ start:47 stop:616 length:570 start_codon:yes stop_codon:yes gene_type:complete